MTQIVHTNVLLRLRGPSLALQPMRGRRRLSTIMCQHAPAGRKVVPLVFRGRDAWQFADLDGLESSARSKALDGAARMQAQYRTTLVGPRDTVVLVTLPLGGGGGGGGGSSGKAIGLSLAAIALIAIAGPVGGSLVGTLGAAGAFAVQAGLVIGGVALSMAAQKASAAKKKTVSDPDVYNVSGGGNLPKPADRRPLIYGRCWTTPPLTQKDYFLYDGTTTVLFKRMTLGIGKFQVHKVRVGEAIFWTEEGGIQPPFSQVAAVNNLGPGFEVLYEAASAISNGDMIGNSSVQGQELPRANENPPYTPWFRLTPQGVTANKVLLAYSWPQLMNATASKPLPAYGDVVFEAQQLDETTGDPIGAPIQIWRETPYTYSRVVYHGAANVDLPADTAWQIRATNAIPRALDINGAEISINDVTWDEMVASKPDLHIRPKTTEIVMRIRGGQGLNLTDYSDVQVEATRIIPVYDAASGTWTEQPTRKAIWAYADLVRSEYGLNDPEGFDLDRALYYANRADLAGFDTYDGQLPNVSSFWEAASEVLHPLRCDPIKVGAIHSFVRDESALEAGGRRTFTRRQIIRDSGSAEFELATDDTSSGDVIVEFNRDGDPKTPDEVRQDKFPATRTPKRYKVAGISDGAHALHHARWLAAVARFRGGTRKITSEWDGRLVYPGTHILSDIWFLQGKTVVGVESHTGNTLHLDADCLLPAGETYVSIRSRNGREWGLLRATIVNGREIALNASDAASLAGTTGLSLANALALDTQDPTTVTIGDLVELQETYIAKSAVPSDEDHVEIEMVLDDARVWQILGETVVAPAPPVTNDSLIDPLEPIVSFVRARCETIENTILMVWSIAGARGGRSYEVQLSYDAGGSWELVSTGVTMSGSYPIHQSLNPIAVRGRAYGRTGLPGPWVTTDFTTVAPIVDGTNITQFSVDFLKLDAQLQLDIASLQAVTDGVIDTARATLRDNLKLLNDRVEALANMAATQATDSYEKREAVKIALNGRVNDTFAAIETTTNLLVAADQVNAETSTALAVRLTSAETGIVGNAAAMQGLQTQVTNINGTVTSLSAFTTTLSARIDNNDLSISGQATATQVLTTRVTSAEGLLTSTSNALTALQSTVSTQGGTILGQSTAISSLTTTVTQQGDAISASATAVLALQASSNAANANLQVVNQASIDRDNAFSGQLTTVAAQAAGVSASGQIAFVASAGPAGAYAAWQLKVTSLAVSSGFTVYAKSDGTSGVAIGAGNFMVYDPNIAGGAFLPMFVITGGKAYFNIPLVVQGKDLEAFAATNSDWGSFPTYTGDVNATTREGSRVLLLATFDGAPGSPLPPGAAGRLQILRNGALIRDAPVSFYVAGNNQNVSNYTLNTFCFCIDKPPAGLNTYTVQMTAGQGPVSIMFAELYK